MAADAARLCVLPLADRVEEELLRRARENGGAALGLGLTTVRELERALLAAAELAPLDGVAADLLAASVLPENETGLARPFLGVYDALREGGCTLAELALVARRLPGLTGRRAQRIARIARDYEKALAARGLLDGESARAALIERLPACRLPDELARAGAIVVEDVLDYSVTRVRILGALGARGVRVTLRLPHLGERPGLASSVEPIERALADANTVETATKEYGGGALAAFHQRLFLEREAPAVVAPVELIEGDDPGAELRAVVGAVRQKLDGGASADDLCVAVRGVATWRARLGGAFDEAGIPWRDRRGAPALEAPPCALALALVDLALHDLPRGELGRLLTSRYVDGGVPATGDEPYLSPRRVAELLRAAGSRDDLGEGHASRLAAFGARLTDDDRKASAAKRAAHRLGDLLPLLKLPASATVSAHLAALDAALDRLGVPKRSRAREEREESRFPSVDSAASRALARDQAGVRALTATGSALTAAARRVGLAGAPISLARFRELFSSVISPATLAARGARGGAITILDAAELTGRAIPHLILAGVVDGRFPLHRASPALFDDEDRAAFNRVAGRVVFRARAVEEPLLFALACAAARDSLTITAARTDGDGRETVRSPYFDEALAAIGQAAPRRVSATVVPPAAECASPTQLLVRAALLARGAEPAVDEPANALLAAVRADPGLGPRLIVAQERARADRPGGAGGRLTDGNARAAVAAKLGRAAAELGENIEWAASATALESYAACPFKFFAAKVLGLPELEPVDDDLDPMEGGNLLHAVARDVFDALGKGGLLPLRGGDRARAERTLALIAVDGALDRWQSERRTGPAALWSLRREQARVAIVRLLEAEAREGSLQTVTALEAPFGFEGTPPLIVPSPDGKRAIAVRGRVDRVDGGAGRLTVIDYKSGRVNDRLQAKDIARTQFQLPLYAAWARTQFPLGTIDACYRSLRDGATSKRLGDACDAEGRELAVLIDLDPERRAAGRERVEVTPAAGALDLPDGGYPSVADNAWALYGGLAAGRFDVRPHDVDQVCKHCAFATVCRIDIVADEEEPE